MRKIDTWLFIVMFAILYITLFLAATFILVPLSTPMLVNSAIATYLMTFIVSSVACFLAAFGLRSYYLLPTSLIKLVNSIVILQFALNLLSMFSEKPTLYSLGGWLVTALGTWIVLYVSFRVSDRYFSK